jgi:flagellar hook-basal body complex protein FliE
MKKAPVIAIIAALALLAAFFGYRSWETAVERDFALRRATAAQAEAEHSKEEAIKQAVARAEAEQHETEAKKQAAAQAETSRLTLNKTIIETELAQCKLAALLQTLPTVDDAGRFVAIFLGAVQRGAQPVDTAVGKITMNMVYHDGGAIAHMVIYCDYPAGSVASSGGPDKVCANASDGAVKNVNGTVRTSSPCQLGDINGLEVVADIPSKDPKVPADASVARLRFFVVGDRLYQVMYIGPAGTETTMKALTFLDSFRLTR